MVMVDQYAVGGFIATLFAFVLLYNIRTRTNKASKIVRKDECIKSSAVGGGSLPDLGGDTDVVIVGAGVAGAALAYTLGKVCN